MIRPTFSLSFHFQGSSLPSGHDHIGRPAAAPGTHQPLAPIEYGRFGAVASSHLVRVGLDLMLAFLTPHDQPHAGRCSSAKRHRRAAIGLQPRRRLVAAVAFGGAYTLGSGKGSRTGSGRSLARIAFKVRMRSENGLAIVPGDVVEFLGESRGLIVR